MQKTDLQQGDVTRLATGFQFVEGPVWHPDGHWLFSDIPANRIHKISPNGALETYREPSGNSNGLTFAPDGRLVACEHGKRRVSQSTAPDAAEVLVESFKGKRLDSPNDVVVHSSGATYFTDPPYGIQPDEQEQPCNGVYRVAPDGAMALLVDDFERPNGLGFSPDEKTLYIDDSHHQHIRAFDVTADGTLENGRLFCDLASDSNGEFLGLIEAPEVPANCARHLHPHAISDGANVGLYRADEGAGRRRALDQSRLDP